MIKFNYERFGNRTQFIPLTKDQGEFLRHFVKMKKDMKDQDQKDVVYSSNVANYIEIAYYMEASDGSIRRIKNDPK